MQRRLTIRILVLILTFSGMTLATITLIARIAVMTWNVESCDGDILVHSLSNRTLASIWE